MLMIKAEAAAGDEIRATAQAMQSLADNIGCHVELRFNGVTCIASPGGNADTLAEEQQRIQRSPEPSAGGKPYAFSRRG